jgi:ribosomal protein L7/L12
MDDSRRETSAGPPLSDDAIAALQRGNKIQAIKFVRQDRNIGLKEAKDAVDDYLRTQPALQSSLAVAQAGATRSALGWLAALVALALVGYWFKTRP